MSKRRSSPSSAGATPAKRPMNRVTLLSTGLLLGALWGVAMCLILWAFGRLDGGSGWVYRIVTTALIGMVVATIFGTATAVRQGEAIGSSRPWRRRSK